MSTDAKTDKRPVLLLFLAVCIIAANMRAAISGLGPLIEQISADINASAATLGALAAVPLIAWAIVSPLAHTLSERFGLSQTVLYSLIALTLGTIWRSVPGPVANLWLGTVLIGAALAIANVLMPAVIKRGFHERVPLVTSIYSALLGGVGALAAGIVVPISHIETGGEAWGWRPALLATGILLPVAIALWAWTMRGPNREPRPVRPAGRRPSTGIWGDMLAWQVAGYMGLQATSFYMLVTWLSPISISLGRTEIVAGVDVMVFQLFSAAGSLVLPFILRGRAKRWVAAYIPVLAVVAIFGLIFAPEFILLWGCFAGTTAGASLGMSLTLMAERSRNHATAAALSGMSQSIGYVIAAFGPIAFGALFTLTGEWLASLLLLLAVQIGQSIIGVLVGRERYVLEGR